MSPRFPLLLLALMLGLAATAGAASVVIPGIANAPGANGTSFQSDLDITNTTATATTATLRFIGYPGSSSQQERTFTINAGESFLLPNVLQSVWSLTNSGGAIEVSSPARLVVSAKTYNNAATGTFGNALPVIDSDLLLVAGEQGISPWLSQSADFSRGFRTNLGIVFPDLAGGSATATAYDARGAVIGTQSFDFPSATFTQVSSISFTKTVADVGRISIDVTRGSASGYTSVVDNVTGDGSVFPAERILDAPVDVVLSGIGRTPGANGTYWRSDVHLVNPAQTPATVGVSYLKPAVDNSAATPVELVLLPGETREITDVLHELFAAPDGSAGALRFTSSRGVLVAGRTSNVDPSGTRPGSFGSQQIPVSFTAFIDASSEAVIPQISQGNAFRTNVGFVSSAAGAVYELRLIKADGTNISSYSGVLAPYSWSQSSVASLFPGASIPDNSRLTIHPTAGALNAYGSAIDQRSGDPIVTFIDPLRCADTIVMTAPTAACTGQQQTATVPRLAGATYQWSIAGGSISAGQRSDTVTFLPGNAAVTIGVSVVRGCLTHLSRTIPIGIAPSVGIVSAAATLAGAPVTISWSIASAGDLTISGTDFPTPVRLAPETRSYTYSPSTAGSKNVTVTATTPCASSSSTTSYTVNSPVGALGPGSGGSDGMYPGLQTFHAASGRDYVVYVPRNYVASEPAYLLFALGGQGEPAALTLQLGWSDLAERDKIIVVTMTPSSSGPNYSGAYDEPEFQTILEAEREVPKHYNVALNHISFWGFSAGAHLTYWLGLEAARSQRINAFAIQAGAIEAAATTLPPPSWPPQAGARRLPVYIGCGTADTQGYGGGLIGALRRNRDMLTAAGYSVQTSEVEGMTHTYRLLDVYRAWDFLKAQSR